jgi:hypothetical protein
MTEREKGPSRGGRPDSSTKAFLAAGAVVLGGVAFYAFVGLTRPAKADWWGVMGDSVAPFTAALNAAALFALLYAGRLQRDQLTLQRTELELQREELRENREEMKAQREQFERTAKAQEALAASQRDLANAQKVANNVHEAAVLATLRGELAQRSHSIVALSACISQTRTAAHVEAHRSGNGNFHKVLAAEIESLELALRRQWDALSETESLVALAEKERKGRGLWGEGTEKIG